MKRHFINLSIVIAQFVVDESGVKQIENNCQPESQNKNKSCHLLLDGYNFIVFYNRDKTVFNRKFSAFEFLDILDHLLR